MKTILVRGGAQTVNIGDISHTPSLLGLLEKHLPDARVILWATTLDRGVDAMLQRRFPKLRIVRDLPRPEANPKNPRPDDPMLSDALKEADIMLHSSGPGFGNRADFVRWHEETGKPFGAYGITLGSKIGIAATGEPEWEKSFIDLLNKASFIFTRETRSLQALKQLNLRTKYVDFSPDVSFAVDLRNDEATNQLMQQSGLEVDRFICAIPRLRISPYWEMRPAGSFSPEIIAQRSAINERFAEPDHAKLRHAITTWVRETGL